MFAERGIDFLTSPLSSNPAKAGVVQGIVGTIVLGLDRRARWPSRSAWRRRSTSRSTRATTLLTRFIQINIRNLAGVPSVVYGLLGLSVFVACLDAVDGDDGIGRNIIAGGLTLAVLVLPIVIITSIEALRAVPNAIREAGYGVGASRWEVDEQPRDPVGGPGRPDRDRARAVPRPRRDRAADPRRRRARLVLRAVHLDPVHRQLHRRCR